MKKTLSIILITLICVTLFAGCTTQPTENTIGTISEETPEKKEGFVYPLPETLDINNLENCTMSVSFKEGDFFTDNDGKMMLSLVVHSYERYDAADIDSLKENDVIVRLKEEVTVTEIQRLDSGLVQINGGDGYGGFDLITVDNATYFEVGPNDINNYYELGKVTLPVSEDFVLADESDINAGEKQYNADYFTSEDAEYNFYPNNTSVEVENGIVVKMNKYYMP